jgi:hypothetical protein
MTNQFSFQLNNPNAPDTVYIGADSSDNSLSLVIAANGTTATTVTAGQPTSYENAENGGFAGTLFYLDLSPFQLTSDELSPLSLEAVGWTSKVYPDDQMICFAPTLTTALSPGAPVTLSLVNFSLATSPGGTSLQLGVYWFDAVSAPDGPLINFTVTLQNPDDDLHHALAITLDPTDVVQTVAPYPDLQNSLTLTFGVGNNQKTVVADPGGNTYFKFQVAVPETDDPDGFYALMTVKDAQSLQVAQGVGADNWRPNSFSDNDPPYWQLVPAAGQPLLPQLGGGGFGTVSFNISDLVARLPPGASTVTVSYFSVPGYQDGTYSINVNKKAHVTIDAGLDRPLYRLDHGQAQVTLSWTAANCTGLSLTEPIPVTLNQNAVPPQYSTTIDGITNFSLQATGDSLINVATTTVTAMAIPVIKTFRASSTTIHKEDFPHDVTFTWNVDTNDAFNHVDLFSGDTDLGTFRAYGIGRTDEVSSTQSIQAPGPAKLIANTALSSAGKPGRDRSTATSGVPTPPTVAQRLMISAFDTPQAQAVQNWPEQFLVGGVAVHPSGGLVAVSLQSAQKKSAVAILGGAPDFRRRAELVAVSGFPEKLVFSSDGSLLYVLDRVSSSIIVIGVTPTPFQDLPYSFATLTTIEVAPATPRDLVLDPDGTLWVVLESQLAGYRSNGSGGFVKSGSVDLDADAFRAVLVPGEPSSLYLANTSTNSVTEVSLGENPKVGATLSIASPGAISATADGTALLVGCQLSPEANSLVQIIPVADFASRSAGPYQSYALPWLPVAIEAIPGSPYALAVGASAPTGQLLNLDNQSSRSIEIGNHAGFALSVADGIAFCTSAAAEIYAISFPQYVAGTTCQIAHQASTGVAVTPDLTAVVTWCADHVSGIGVCWISGSSPPVTVLTRYMVQDVAISPGASDNTLYAIIAQDHSWTLNVCQINLGNAGSPISLGAAVSLGQNPTRRPLKLALSSDGSTLFVLVADGPNNYNVSFSILTFSAALQGDASTMTLTAGAEVPVFTVQLWNEKTVIPMAAAPDGTAVYVFDPTTCTLHGLQGWGATYQPVQPPLQLLSDPEKVQRGATSLMAMDGNGTTARVLIPLQYNLAISTIDLAGWTSLTVQLSLDDPGEQSACAAMAASLDGRRILVSFPHQRMLRIIDTASLLAVQAVAWQKPLAPGALAIAPDDSAIYVADQDSATIGIIQQVEPAAMPSRR